jgi:NifB/MoaA-like Fe-S oxidoreductase
VLEKQVKRLNAKVGTRLRVVAVENKYFGGDVSVAGLLTGGDMIAVSEKVRGKFVLVPRTTLKSDEEIMLDGKHLHDLESKFGVPIEAVEMKSLETVLRRLSN